MSLKEVFYQKLGSIYPADEIDSIFFLYLSDKFKIEKYQYILNKEILPFDEVVEGDLDRLAQGMPIQYLIGFTHFMDLKIRVNKEVLIPRQETEELVANVVAENEKQRNLSVLEIGTGSGCIALAIKKDCPSYEIIATDFSLTALEVARENGRNNQLEVDFLLHDILNESADVLPENLDLIISNPPYIPISEKEKLHTNVVDHEPGSALWVPNDDPLIFYKRIIEVAAQRLKSSGKLYFETHENFHPETLELLQKAPFHHLCSIKDFKNNPRFITAQKI